MNKAFTSATILARSFNDSILDTLRALILFLEKKQVTLYLESKTAIALNSQLPTVDKAFLGNNTDIVIVIGGDGSLLHAARCVVEFDTPIIGINRGNLGFLTDILPHELEGQFTEVLAGKYQEEQRFLLDINIGTDTPIQALNEVVLLPHKSPHLVEFEIYIGDKLVCNQRSDGLIISTPTGSTAYSLSGGGPILHPELNAIVIVPMFPHTLSMRPIVVSGDSEITIKLSLKNNTHAKICCDGEEPIEIYDEQPIVITKKKRALRLIHPMSYDYYGALRSKLHWATKPGQG